MSEHNRPWRGRKPKRKKLDKLGPLRPSREKIPEGEGNLRRRADWFQKRTGQTAVTES